MTDRIPELPIDIHFLDLSETCLYMVHFGLGPFFLKLQNDCLNRFKIKANQNKSRFFYKNLNGKLFSGIGTNFIEKYEKYGLPNISPN